MIEISMKDIEYDRLKAVLTDLKESAMYVDAYEDSVFEDYRYSSEREIRYILDTLLNLEL